MKFFALVAASAAFLCAQAPLQPNATLPPGTVVAKTADGTSITAGELQKVLDSGDPNMINAAKRSPEQFLANVLVLRYLTAEAEKAHIADQSPYKEQLQFIHNRLIANAMVNQLRENYNVPEEAINDFYAHNQSRYEQAWIKVIAIGFCPSVSNSGDTSAAGIAQAAKEAMAAAHCTSKRTEDAAHDIATGLVGKIRGGADFVKLVAQYSEDADSKATEGDFGLVTRENSIPQEIKNVVFSLNKGDVSEPVRSGSFFYIVKIKDKSVQPISNVREPIVQVLKQKQFTDFMDDLAKRFKPTIEHPEFFTPAAPGGPPQLLSKP